MTEHFTAQDLTQLQTGWLTDEEMEIVHRCSTVLTHDVMINVDGKLLLVRRENDPARGLLYPIGGRALRGMPYDESLRKRVRSECGLEIEDLVRVGEGRNCYPDDPFGHGKGTDTHSLMYVGRGVGEINLDRLHSTPTLVGPNDYTPAFRSGLDSWVRQFMDKAVEHYFGFSLAPKVAK